MQKQGYTLFILLTALVLSSCSSKSSKAPTYQATANMRYMATTQKIHAELRFTSLKNDGKSKLPTEARFNSQPMKYIAGGVNVFLFDGASTPVNGEHSFNWSAEAKKEEQVKLTLNEMREIAFNTPKLSHSNATKLKWQGESLKKSDSIVLLWDDVENRATYQTQAIGASSTPILDIPAFELKKVPVGKYKVTVIRKTLQSNIANGCQINAQTEYYHTPFEMEITP